jgi:hypothetical protein
MDGRSHGKCDNFPDIFLRKIENLSLAYILK